MSNRHHSLTVRFLYLTLLVALVSSGPPLGAEPAGGEADVRRKEFLEAVKKHKAMSPRKVTELLGKPQRKSRQILHRRYVEQWLYDSPLALCVEFEAAAGQKLRLQSVHLLSSRNP
jgi:hypothetical protein